MLIQTEIPTGQLLTMSDGTYARCKANSSMVKSWSYLTDLEQLLVVYNNDKRYVYHKVPASIVISLIACSSVGKTINELVKKGGYDYKKLDD